MHRRFPEESQTQVLSTPRPPASEVRSGSRLRRRRTARAARIHFGRPAAARRRSDRRKSHSRRQPRSAGRGPRHRARSSRLRRSRKPRSSSAVRLLVRFQSVDQGQNLLNLVADQMPPQLERRAIKKLAVGQPGPTVASGYSPVDQARARSRDSRSRPVGVPPAIRAEHPPPDRRAARAIWPASGITMTTGSGPESTDSWIKLETFAGHIPKRRPAYRIDPITCVAAPVRNPPAPTSIGPVSTLPRRSHPRISHPQNVRQPLAVGLDRSLIGCRLRKNPASSGSPACPPIPRSA